MTGQACQRHQIENGWECHYCGSLWSEILMGLGWLPLSCPEREPPRRGDVRLRQQPYPPGTPLAGITDFEVWDGSRWVTGSDAEVGLLWDDDHDQKT